MTRSWTGVQNRCIAIAACGAIGWIVGNADTGFQHASNWWPWGIYIGATLAITGFARSCYDAAHPDASNDEADEKLWGREAFAFVFAALAIFSVAAKDPQAILRVFR